MWDASPAAFTAHSEDRDDAWFIAEQQVRLKHNVSQYSLYSCQMFGKCGDEESADPVLSAIQIGATHPLGRVADVILGGGRCAFIPQSEEGSCRYDDKDLIKSAKEDYGWNVVETSEALTSAQKLVRLSYSTLFRRLSTVPDLASFYTDF